MDQPVRALSEAERLDWLRLIRTENIGPISFRQLLRRFGSAGAALDALPDLARCGGRAAPIRPCPKAEAERELAALDRLGARLIALCEPDYPRPLASVEDAPPLIAVRGRVSLLGGRSIAIVGARNASINGRRFAERLARELGEAGLVVVSGLARGIDAAAHEGALATGTVAMLAGGVDVAYPRENAGLQDRIAAAGALVSECAVGTEPQASHFPRRNRLVSGVALGVVVVEAALRSGSLITARLAAEQGRDVFAVPGSPLDPRAQGCNRLIRSGATLVQDSDDVLQELDSMVRSLPVERPPELPAPAKPEAAGSEALTAARAAILERLSPSPTPVDELIRDCQLSAAVVLTALLELELAGRIERQTGNRVALL